MKGIYLLCCHERERKLYTVRNAMHRGTMGKQLKPILELIERVQITDIYDFDVYPFIVNNYRGNFLSICNLGIIQLKRHWRTVLHEFDLCKFLHLSGINVVIQGNIEKRKEIKQWWYDRMVEKTCAGFDSNHLFYGIVGGNYNCYYESELPEGTHIINPFYTREIDESLPKAKYTIDQLIEKAGLNKDDIEIVEG